ncbi:hypothetical protein [Komagataeibacter sp. FNDCR2]|uniref:hypothetical protein n=1 Tax=Komagataeibacter sp. FNDCR2 TaxID=2878682 RepID=UPI001E44E7D9|nr:hypothetical protein [Komagataeibacter sp. FNDCR2]MCE2576685.1 hypothetical protein [Komagataeibacter sp. FNDCR2]
MTPPQKRGRVVRAMKWLSFPFLVQFVRSYQLARDGMRTLGDAPREQDVPTFVEGPVIDDRAIEQREDPKTSRYRRFCVLLLIIIVAGLWCDAILWSGQGLFSAVSIGLLALALILVSQYASLRFPGGSASAVASMSQEDAMRLQARLRTRRYGRFCALLLVILLGMWAYAVIWQGQGVFSPASIRSVALTLILGSQYVSLCFSNWMARLPGRRSFSEFLQDGREFWPR